MKKICVLLLANLVFSSTVIANTVTIEGKVTSVKMFGSLVAIYVDNIANSACGGAPRPCDDLSPWCGCTHF